MAKKKRKEPLTPAQRKEIKYNRAIRRMEGAKRMLQAEDRLRMNRQAMRMFKSLKGYKESREYFLACKEQMPALREEFRESIYNAGMEKKLQAKKSTDYTEAIAIWKRIKVPYKDIGEQMAECERLRAQARKREKMKSRCINLSIWALLAAAVCFVLYLRTPAAFYREGRLMMGLQDYERAKNLFQNSTGYKDTDALVLECYYQRALQHEKAGEVEKAVRLLQTRVGDYKDSLEKKAEFEQELFAAAKAGDAVLFGDSKWLVAKAQKDRLLLVQKTPQYVDVAFGAGEEEFAWESSKMRKWLNADFINENFSEAEKKFLIPVSIRTEANSLYQTRDDSVTEDIIFLLSEQEAEQYGEILTEKENRYSWWLRTPGAEKESAEYVTADGRVILYGNIKTAKDLAVRPALWVLVQ